MKNQLAENKANSDAHLLLWRIENDTIFKELHGGTRTEPERKPNGRDPKPTRNRPETDRTPKPTKKGAPKMTNLDLLETMTSGIAQTADTDPSVMAAKLIVHLSNLGWHFIYGPDLDVVDLH